VDPSHSIPFSRPSLGEAEVEAVRRAIEAGHVGGNGPICRRVEARLAERIGCHRVILTPNATQAMEVALAAHGIGPGDEVLMPSFAFVSQANVILARGARPVFCEIDPATMNIDADDAARRVTEHTRCVMPVHYAGIAADLDTLRALAKEHGLLLLEDAAQCFGSRYRGRHLGTFGDGGCLSFHESKNVGCGEGGALLLTDEGVAQLAETVHEKGTNRGAFLRGEVDKYTWVGPGGSFVLSDLLAAILEVQLDREEELQRGRRRAWDLYQAGLEDLERRGLVRRPFVPEGAEHNAHIYALRARTPELRDELLAKLRGAGICATFHFQPLHASSYARDVLQLPLEPLPHTEEAAATIVRLPLFAALTEAEALRVVDAVAAVCARA
jgi:dTDP-4-amino-4,6-dideoxygalactose transaminase